VLSHLIRVTKDKELEKKKTKAKKREKEQKSSFVGNHSEAGFFFLAAKYGGKTCDWWLVANTPTTGSPSIFCSQKKEPYSEVS
jgi:hypothetical protein